MDKEGYKLSADDFVPLSSRERSREEAVRPNPGYWKETAMILFDSTAVKMMLFLLSTIILGAIVIPMMWPLAYDSQDVLFANQPFFSVNTASGTLHPFGTDHLGRDMFSRVWYGARVSLTVAGVVALIDCLVGVVYGGLSGYLGGATDNVMMRLLEVISGIPYLIIVLLLMAMLPRGLGTIILAYSLVGWTGMARLVRAQVVSLKQQEFMVAAKVMGVGMWRCVFAHLLPNLLGLVIVNITLDIPSIIFTEAFLSMLGLGVPPPYPSLGVMANEGIANFQMYPHQLAVPAILICMLMLSFNLMGDRIQDALNPKLRRIGGYESNSKS